MSSTGRCSPSPNLPSTPTTPLTRPLLDIEAQQCRSGCSGGVTRQRPEAGDRRGEGIDRTRCLDLSPQLEVSRRPTRPGDPTAGSVEWDANQRVGPVRLGNPRSPLQELKLLLDVRHECVEEQPALRTRGILSVTCRVIDRPEGDPAAQDPVRVVSGARPWIHLPDVGACRGRPGLVSRGLVGEVLLCELSLRVADGRQLERRATRPAAEKPRGKLARRNLTVRRQVLCLVHQLRQPAGYVLRQPPEHLERPVLYPGDRLPPAEEALLVDEPAPGVVLVLDPVVGRPAVAPDSRLGHSLSEPEVLAAAELAGQYVSTLLPHHLEPG